MWLLKTRIALLLQGFLRSVMNKVPSHETSESLCIFLIVTLHPAEPGSKLITLHILQIHPFIINCEHQR
jgi:hypothetical protein